MFKKLFLSKKFVVLACAVIGIVGTGLSGVQEWGMAGTEISALIVAYLVAQGAADFGKEGK